MDRRELLIFGALLVLVLICRLSFLLFGSAMLSSMYWGLKRWLDCLREDMCVAGGNGVVLLSSRIVNANVLCLLVVLFRRVGAFFG